MPIQQVEPSQTPQSDSSKTLLRKLRQIYKQPKIQAPASDRRKALPSEVQRHLRREAPASPPPILD
jgi:hypothetical protein